MRNRSLLLAVCLVTAATAAAPGEIAVRAFTVLKLTASERREVEQVACLEPHQLPLDSAVGLGIEGKSREYMRVAVRCAPHEKIGRQRVMHSTSCEKIDAGFICESSHAILFAEFGGRRFQSGVRPTEISIKETLDILDYVDSLRIIEPTQDDLFDERDVPVSFCGISSKAVDTFVVECDDLEISVLAIRSPGGVHYRRVETAPTP